MVSVRDPARSTGLEGRCGRGKKSKEEAGREALALLASSADAFAVFTP